MKKYFAQMLDDIAIFQKHLEKSKESQFSLESIEEISIESEVAKAFYKKPPIPEIEFTQNGIMNNYFFGKYTYESEAGEGGQKQANGEYYAYAKEEAPNVIVIHGWRSSSLKRINETFLNEFLESGYNLYFVKQPYHFNRIPENSYDGEYTISANVMRTVSAIRQAVSEVRALIGWIKENKQGKVILVGISLGGLIANLVSIFEEDVDALVSVMYVNSLAYMVWNTPLGKYIKADFNNNKFSFEELKKYWAIIESSNWPTKVSKENIFLITGLYDKFVHKQDADKLWEAWERPNRILYECGHSGLEFYKGKIKTDVIKFIKAVTE